MVLARRSERGSQESGRRERYDGRSTQAEPFRPVAVHKQGALVAGVQQQGSRTGPRRAAPAPGEGRFVAISETNLDEFFMIRVAGFQQQVASELPTGPGRDDPRGAALFGSRPQEEFFEERRRILNVELMPALEEAAYPVPHGKVRAAERRELGRGSSGTYCPSLRPRHRPGPPLPAHLQPIAQLARRDRGWGRRVMARVKVPTS